MRLFAIPVSLSLILLTCVTPMSVQLDQGQIAGSVQDASQAAVAGASVSATGVQGVAYTATTSENGAYVLTNLPVGLYEVSVQSSGFKQAVRTNVKVDAAARTSRHQSRGWCSDGIRHRHSHGRANSAGNGPDRQDCRDAADYRFGVERT